MYEEIRRPTCVDPKGSHRIIPLIELYSDVMCHASALSKASSSRYQNHPLKLFNFIGKYWRSGGAGSTITTASTSVPENPVHFLFIIITGLFTFDNLLRLLWLVVLVVGPTSTLLLCSSALPPIRLENAITTLVDRPPTSPFPKAHTTTRQLQSKSSKGERVR